MGDRPLVLVLLGAPGAGKGTQGARLAARAQISHVSTGDLFREAVQARSPAGERAESYLRSGQLVPDQVVLQLLEEYFGDIRSLDICLDGFPRTYQQAITLDVMLAQLDLSIAAVLHIDVPDNIALERLVGRGRSDDTLETAHYRLELYHAATEPLIRHYREAGVLRDIDGAGDADAVESRVWHVVSTMLKFK